MEKGLDIFTALDMGITNKTFDTYEQTLIRDTIRTRISKKTEERFVCEVARKVCVYMATEIEEQELREAKRACNFIWAAAENYELEPLFLAFASNGTADMYLNLIIGLTYKWYDQEKIDDFFNQLGGKDRELYEGLLWIGLENALYQKERKIRSVMDRTAKGVCAG